MICETFTQQTVRLTLMCGSNSLFAQKGTYVSFRHLEIGVYQQTYYKC